MLASSWSILRDSAVFLLLGFLVAALAEVVLAGGWIARRLSRRGSGSVLLATLVGVPLPLCSCSVLPAAMALRRHGASRGATLAFLVSTPETSVTSVLLTWGLLGPLMAVVRPVAAALTAISAGLLGDALQHRGEDRPAVAPGAGAAALAHLETAPRQAVSCPPGAGGGAGQQDTGATSRPGGAVGPREPGAGGDASACSADACRDEEPWPPAGLADGRSLFSRFRAGLRYAFVDLFDDVFPWVLAGVLAAAAIDAWLPPELLGAGLGRSWLAIPLMIAVGVPLYICAEASTPVAAALVAGGLSPGAALVLLLVGPATNLGALGVLRKLLGGRTVVAYLLAIVGVAVLSGIALDLLLGEGIAVVQDRALQVEVLPGPLESLAALLFLALGAGTLVRMVRRRHAHRHAPL